VVLQAQFSMAVGTMSITLLLNLSSGLLGLGCVMCKSLQSDDVRSRTVVIKWPSVLLRLSPNICKKK